VAIARDRHGTPRNSANSTVRTNVIPSQFARTESSGRRGEEAPLAATVTADFDKKLVKDSFAHLMANSDWAMEYLYARLFVQNPDLRALFPLGMSHTRVATFEMLARLIWSLDDAAESDQLLGQIARDHRKFGVKDKYLEPFFAAVLGTAEHVIGPAWTSEMGTAWRAALDYFAGSMSAAAAADAKEHPAWWVGEIVQHDQRTSTVAVLTIRPDQPLHFRPGQHIPLQVPRWPRIWRNYSIANAPRENGLIDLHVRAVPGGMVSTALVSHCGAGDIVMLGAPRGDLSVPADPGLDLVCVAGGTGLAPIKAIVEAVVGTTLQGRRREVTLYVGARRSQDLYDMRDLETLRLAYPSLTLIPVAERELDFAGRVGRLPEVVSKQASFRDTEVYISGPASMISATVRALSGRVPANRIQHDSLDLIRAASRSSAVQRDVGILRSGR
jgi:NAD(P)H-flavin reductase/hemoglobin-like flavoprotein